ncbi:hypothetical protein AB0383_17375 [Amycolatopsis sp. NPDC051373]|uniref:hypothetical protein n=1 Tax=Amycolatopsis sp. NPDC051373 TaxID=3155801 RepID=UPI00344FC52D
MITLVFGIGSPKTPFPLWVPIVVLVLCTVGIGAVSQRARRWPPLLRGANELWGVPVPDFAFDDLVRIKGTMQGIDDLYTDVYG